MHKLSCTCLPRLDGLSSPDLGRLFPAPSSTAPLLLLLQEAGVDGFQLSSIVVYQDEIPILLLPLFETRFDLSRFAKGWLKKILKAAGRMIPSLFEPRILSVGLVAGEWSEIGIDPRIDKRTFDVACEMAYAALQTLAGERKSDIVAFYNFNQYGRLPAEIRKKFHQVQFQSSGRLPVDCTSMDGFLTRFSKSARKEIRRKMRDSAAVTVIRSCTIAPYLERIYRLYLATVARSTMSFGVQKRLFFEKICERVPGAEYTLYFVQDELIAFNLLIVNQEVMADKYFCMDYLLGRRYNLYVLSWLENVRTCIERKIPLYYTGQGAEKTKVHLGATLIPGFVLFKHRRLLIDRFLMAWPAMSGKLLSMLGFWPKMENHGTKH